MQNLCFVINSYLHFLNTLANLRILVEKLLNFLLFCYQFSFRTGQNVGQQLEMGNEQNACKIWALNDVLPPKNQAMLWIVGRIDGWRLPKVFSTNLESQVLKNEYPIVFSINIALQKHILNTFLYADSEPAMPMLKESWIGITNKVKAALRKQTGEKLFRCNLQMLWYTISEIS